MLVDGLGTLVALTPPVPRLRRELARRFDLSVSEAEAQHALATEIGFYRAHMGLGRDTAGLAALRRRCAEILRDALPEPGRLTRAGIDAVTDALLASLRFEAYPDARELLVRARERRRRVVVVSNWDVSLLEVLELVGLAPLLDGVVTSAAIGAAKPAPAIFRHALALAGTNPERAVHVGDSVGEDVHGALACGIAPVLVRRDPAASDSIPPHVPTIASLTELEWP
ncbi:MAG: HAD-IA family hydrolase [Solirubrobacteraceae bacterium]